MKLPKFTWGTGIFLFYTIFASSLIFQVYQSTRYDHSLVVEDYYAQDLNYQAIYDRKQNSLSLSEPVTAQVSDGSEWLDIRFPEEVGAVSGEVLLYRPSTRHLDVNIPLVFSPNTPHSTRIPVDQLTPGRWLAKINWTANGREFLDEIPVKF